MASFVGVDFRVLVMRAIPGRGALIVLAAAAAALCAGPTAGAERESAPNQAWANCLLHGNSAEFCAHYIDRAQSPFAVSRDPDDPAVPARFPTVPSIGAGGVLLLLIIRFAFRRIFASGMQLLLLPLRRYREQARRRDAEASSIAGALRAAAAADDHNQAIDAVIAAAIAARSEPTPPAPTASIPKPVPAAANGQARPFGRRVSVG